MSGTVEIRASDPASASRALPWPILEAGNASYPAGVYRISVDYRGVGSPDKAVSITHEVEGAPLIDRWLAEGKLRYACAVAVPRSAYRELERSTAATQVLKWEPEDLGSHPVFSPMVLANETITHVVDAAKDGLDALWDGRGLEVPKGGRVAVGQVFALKSGLLGLLDFSLDEKLGRGQFRVEASQEDGFKFKIRLAGNLYGYLSGGRKEEVGTNIMTHVVSAALGVLASKYSEDDGGEGWRSYPNLEALAALLERRGLVHWSDKEAFDPALTATTLHPHEVPWSMQSEGDDG